MRKFTQDRRFVLAFGLVFLSLAVLGPMGCSDAKTTPNISRASTADWSQVRLMNTSPGEAYDAGLYAMRQWFRLAETDPEQGLIHSVPSEYEQKGGDRSNPRCGDRLQEPHAADGHAGRAEP